MKKVLAMILTGVMLVAAVGCGSKADNTKNENAATEESTVEENTATEEGTVEEDTATDEVVEEDTTADEGEEVDTTVEEDTTTDEVVEEDTTADEGTEAATGATAILGTVWASYGDAEKFPIGGGDSANMVMDVPGAFDATNTEELDVTLGFPAAQAGLIDDAASIMHMMNANTFTCGAYHVTDAANATTLADALKENILARQWMCGMPEKLLIATVDGDYVVAAFGTGDNIEVFKTKLAAAYTGTTVVYEEAITE